MGNNFYINKYILRLLESNDIQEIYERQSRSIQRF